MVFAKQAKATKEYLVQNLTTISEDWKVQKQYESMVCFQMYLLATIVLKNIVPNYTKYRYKLQVEKLSHVCNYS